MNYSVKTTCPSPIEYNILRSSVTWGTFSETLIREALKKSLFSITIYANSEAIGMGRVTGDGVMYFYVQDVIVLPEFQQHGIGSVIMDNIMQYIHENAVNNSVVALMSAVGKEGFYEKYGFIKRPNKYLGCGMSMCIEKGSE